MRPTVSAGGLVVDLGEDEAGRTGMGVGWLCGNYRSYGRWGMNRGRLYLKDAWWLSCWGWGLSLRCAAHYFYKEHADGRTA